MAVADTRKTRGPKRSQPGSTVQAKPKKIGRPPHGGTQCSHPGCINKAQTRGKCRTHTGGGKCSNPECDKQAQFKGLCAGHGGRRICSHPGCDKKVASKGKCGDHGGGRPSWHPERRNSTRAANKRNHQEDTMFSMLASTVAVMPQIASTDNHGSMVSLLLGGAAHGAAENGAMATATNAEIAVQITESAASGIISEVLL